MPVALEPGVRDAGRQRLAGRDARAQRRSASARAAAQQRAVHGRRREQRRDAEALDRLQQRVRPGLRDRRASRRRSAAGTARAPPRPNVNASGGVPAKTSSGRGARMWRGERVADRRAGRGGSARSPSASPVVPDVNAISATSSAAVSTGSEPPSFAAASRSSAPNASSSPSTGCSARRLLDLGGHAVGGQRVGDLRLGDHLRQLGGAQQRHRRDGDAAGHQHAEPAGDELGRVRARSSTRLPGTRPMSSTSTRAIRPGALAQLGVGPRRASPWMHGCAGEPAGRAARRRRSAARGTAARAARRPGPARPRAAGGGRGRRCRRAAWSSSRAPMVARAMISCCTSDRALVDPQRAHLAVEALDVACAAVTPRPPQSCTASSITRCAVSVACSLAIAASRVMRAAGDVLRPGGAVDEQRAGVDPERHLGELGLHELEVGHRAAEQLPAGRARERLVERAPGEAERRRADRRPEHVERRERDLEALALARRAAAAGTRQSSSSSVASGCGAITSMRSATRRPGASASSTNAVSFSPVAREHGVEVGDPAVGDPRLRAVEDVAVAVGGRGGGIAATSEPASGSDSANAAMRSPAATPGR